MPQIYKQSVKNTHFRNATITLLWDGERGAGLVSQPQPARAWQVAGRSVAGGCFWHYMGSHYPKTLHRSPSTPCPQLLRMNIPSQGLPASAWLLRADTGTLQRPWAFLVLAGLLRRIQAQVAPQCKDILSCEIHIVSCGWAWAEGWQGKSQRLRLDRGGLDHYTC